MFRDTSVVVSANMPLQVFILPIGLNRGGGTMALRLLRSAQG